MENKILTNEDKAKELAVNYKVTLNDVQEGFQEQIVEQACMRMALWKEQQMIEKAAKAYCKTCKYGPCKVTIENGEECKFLFNFKQAI